MARARQPRVPEKTEQAHVVQLLRSIGCRVWVAGTRRPRGDYQGTCQTPGLPDLVAFLPPHQRGVLFVEVKARGGRLSPDQVEFRKLALDCHAAALGVHHVVGGLEAVIVYLVSLGLVRAESFPHYRLTAMGISA